MQQHIIDRQEELWKIFNYPRLTSCNQFEPCECLWSKCGRSNFFTDLFLALSSLLGAYIIAGDWNCTLDPVMDRFTCVDQTHNKSRAIIIQLMKEFNLIDVWRHFKSDQIAHSCYSGAYKTFFRIDYFLISTLLTSKIDYCFYDSVLFRSCQ